MNGGIIWIHNSYLCIWNAKQVGGTQGKKVCRTSYTGFKSLKLVNLTNVVVKMKITYPHPTEHNVFLLISQNLQTSMSSTELQNKILTRDSGTYTLRRTGRADNVSAWVNCNSSGPRRDTVSRHLRGRQQKSPITQWIQQTDCVLQLWVSEGPLCSSASLFL